MADIETLIKNSGFTCKCGKTHHAKVKKVIIRAGAINEVSGIAKEFGCKKAFVLADENTFAAAGDKVISELKKGNIPYTLYILKGNRPEPDEHLVGSVMLHYDASCNMIISIGSGVINDTGKIVANAANVPYMIIGTAPSMDGYASGTSSVIRDGLKVSVNSRCPDIVIGDIDVLKASPMRMIQSGIGDMLAKYISICEWNISRIINGEYYCEETASLITEGLNKCVSYAKGITKRDPDAVMTVMEGMVLSGIAANYAGVSRPVSGMEHYFSHVWDMRMVEFGRPADFHGIQCGIGTVDSLKVYEEIKKLVPDRKKALSYVEAFDYEEWKKFLIKNLGKSADGMIENEEKEHKYDVNAHKARLESIISNWDAIIAEINKLPSSEEIEKLLISIGAPTKASEIGITAEEERNAFLITKDIRDKYIGSRLLWDIGELENVADKVFPL